MDIVSRASWGAEPPRTTPVPMRLPVSSLWLHHSVTGTTSDPRVDMRQLQHIAFSRQFSDVSYSWAIHSSGVVLEGRGVNVGAHTGGRNSSSFGVALIGNYESRVVTDAQVDSVRQLVAWLIGRNALNPGLYPTGGHRQVPGAATACPGEYAMRRLPEMRAPWTGIPDPPKEKVMAEFDPPLRIVAWANNPAGPGGWGLGPDGGLYALGGAPFTGSAAGKSYFAGRVGARLELVGGRPVIVATSGERYGPDY